MTVLLQTEPDRIVIRHGATGLVIAEVFGPARREMAERFAIAMDRRTTLAAIVIVAMAAGVVAFAAGCIAACLTT